MKNKSGNMKTSLVSYPEINTFMSDKIKIAIMQYILASRSLLKLEGCDGEHHLGLGLAAGIFI